MAKRLLQSGEPAAEEEEVEEGALCQVRQCMDGTCVGDKVLTCSPAYGDMALRFMAFWEDPRSGRLAQQQERPFGL